jgi:hypothetical protein
MFDTIKCNHPLPLPLSFVDMGVDIYDSEFQTKDLENALSHYILTEDGDLLYENVQGEWESDDNAFLKGYFKEISRTIENTYFHGKIEFYYYKDIEIDDTYTTVDITYLATFTRGKLDYIKIIDFSIEDTTQYHKDIESSIKKAAEYRNRWYNKYFFNTFPVYFIRKIIILGLVNFLCRLTDKLRYFTIRYL